MLPPFTGVAVNVTGLPGQIAVEEDVIDTAGVRLVFTVMVIGLLVPVGVVTQTSLLVMITFTWSPLASVDVVNVLLFVPAFILFTCH